MHCPNCGKLLEENEVCTCTSVEEIVEEAVVQETPVQEEIPVAPPVEEQPPVEPTFNGFVPPVAENQNPYQTGPTYYNPAMPPLYYDPSQFVTEPSSDYPMGYKIKKKYVAAILAWVLGIFGIHNFYLGHTEKGIAQLLLSTLGCLILIGPMISMVWVLVEFVQILTDSINADGKGYKLQTFAEEIAMAQAKNNEK